MIDHLLHPNPQLMGQLLRSESLRPCWHEEANAAFQRIIRCRDETIENPYTLLSDKPDTEEGSQARWQICNDSITAR
jgi:hypothetical protein